MLQYLLKFSISLAVLFVFYTAVLRPLTFYTWNRFYLLCYSLCSFIIPFIDITPWVVKKGVDNSSFVSVIPTLGNYAVYANGNTRLMPAVHRVTANQWLLILFCTGVLVMLFRFVMQYRSLRRIRRQSVLLNQNDDVQLFQTAARVSPFSFGNAIYFNNSLHSAEELHKIIQHEFVHVKQKHSVDMLVGELLCIVNWFNPFAWLIRRAIRQNLEFIADNAVIENGLDKKEYQYLLLKVIGIPQYSIGNHFNFSNLKKRITMMNKIKSAKLHLTKFLFVLPLLAVLLLAFRRQIHNEPADRTVSIAGMVVDMATMQPIADAAVFCSEKNATAVTDKNGYYFLQLIYENKPLQFTLQVTKKGYSPLVQTENWGNFYEEDVRKLYSNSIELFGLGKASQHRNGFSFLANNVAAKPGLNYDAVLLKLNEFKKSKENSKALWSDTVPGPPPPPPPTFSGPPANINKKGYIISTADNNGECIVLVKDKSNKIVKAVTLTEWNNSKNENESQYGKLPVRPVVPPVPAGPASPPLKINADIKPVPATPADNSPKPVAPVSPTKLQAAIGLSTGPLIVVDGKEQPEGFDINSIPPEAISVINVLKDKSAIEKYGAKGNNGVIELTTSASSGATTALRHDNGVVAVTGYRIGTAASGNRKTVENSDTTLHRRKLELPANVLIKLDGKEISASEADYVIPADIDNVHVLQAAAAKLIYGDKAKNGAIEITTKKFRAEKKYDVQYKADASVRMHFDQFTVNGSITSAGNESIIDGAFSFETKTEGPLLIFDGHELPGITSFSRESGRYIMRILNANDGIAKYGEKGKHGVIEITTNKSAQLQKRILSLNEKEGIAKYGPVAKNGA